MKPDPFEHNLRLLLGRSWQRIEPDPAFVQRLEQACAKRAVERFADAIPTAPVPRLRLVPLAAALAAAAAVLWIARPLWRPGVAPAPTLDTILASGHVALRPASGGDWRSVPAGSRLVAGATTVARLPDSASLSIGWEAPVARAELAPGSRASFGADAGFALLAGKASFTSGSQDFRLAAGSVELSARDARLVATTSGPNSAITVASGTVQLVGGPRLPARSQPYQLRHGSLLEPPGGSPTQGEPGAGRIPVPGPSEPGSARDPEPAGPVTAALLRARALDPQGSALPTFRLWLRKQVNLPEVAEAEPQDVAPTDAPIQLEPGTYTIGAEAPGFAPILLRDVTLALGDNPALDLAFTPGRPLAGYALDAATGAPIQGALVVIEDRLAHEVIHAQGLEFEPVPFASARSDTSGRWRIDHAPLGTLTLRAISASHAPRRIEQLTVQPAESSGAAQEVPHFQLRAGATLEGHVEQLDGSPWPGTAVIASRIRMDGGEAPMTYGYAQTAPDGSFRMDDLPDGSYVVLLPDEASSGRMPRIRHVQLTGAGTRFVRFPGAADRKSGARVRLAVRLSDGKPAASVNLTLTSEGTGEWQSTITGDDGVGEILGVAPGRYEVALALGEGYDSMVFGRFVEVGPQAEQSFELSAGPVRLSGTALGLTGGFVYVQRRVGGRWQGAGSSQVDRAGRWQIVGLVPGELRGGLFGRNASEGYAPIQAFDLLDKPDQVLALKALPGAELTVRVRDGQGQPVQGASITLTAPDGTPLLFSQDNRTDAAGVCPVPILPEGRWTIRARTAGGAETRVERFFPAGEPIELELMLP